MGGLIALAASAITIAGTLIRDHIQAKRDKRTQERQELLAACRAFLRGVEIRRGHITREQLEKAKLSDDIVTEGLHEVIRGNADVQLLASSRRVADAADALWGSMYGERAGIDVMAVNEHRAEFIAAVHKELDMTELETAQRPWWRRVLGG